jgi:hypothetical protein
MSDGSHRVLVAVEVVHHAGLQQTILVVHLVERQQVAVLHAAAAVGAAGAAAEVAEVRYVWDVSISCRAGLYLTRTPI